MTNTNDFRRYTYANDPTYLLNQFDFQRGSQAPKIAPKKETAPGLKVRENVKVKSKAQLDHEQRLAIRNMIQIMVIAVFCLAMIGLVLNSLAVKNELTKEISAKETAISNAQSEHISLQSELDSLVSMSMIDKYAVENLGMQKVQSNQIQYIDVNEYKAKRADELKKKQAKEQAQKKAVQKKTPSSSKKK